MGVIDPQTDKLVASIPVGKIPVAIAYGLGSIWVANQDDGTVTRIDPKTHTVQGTIGIGGTPIALAVGNGAVWVSTLEGRLFKIDTRLDSASQVPVRLAGHHYGGGIGSSNALLCVAAPPGAVWVLWTGGDEIVRIDPSSGRVEKRVNDLNPSFALALGSGAIWLGEPSSVSRIDCAPPSSRVARRSASVQRDDDGRSRRGLGLGGKSGSGDVWQISPSSTAAVGRTLVGRETAHIAAGAGAVWVARPKAGTVVKIDPSTGKVVQTLAVGSGAYGLTTGAGWVWVTTVQPGSARDVPQDAG